MDYIEANDLISEAVKERWPDIVPVHALLLVDAYTPDGKRMMYVLSDSDCPAWTLHGMLALVQTDVQSLWQSSEYEPEVEWDSEDDD